MPSGIPRVLAFLHPTIALVTLALLFHVASIGLRSRERGGQALRPVHARRAPWALAAWVVAVGTGRTQAMQQRWETLSFYPRQMRMLSALVAEVPDVTPGALLLLMDEGGTWRSNFGFHHAVEYLYQGRAVGLAWGVWTGMFPAFFGPEGVASEPWPAVRRAWGARASLHRYDQIIVVRHTPSGTVHIVDEWPAVLPRLPPGTTYRPRAQLAALREPIPERSILAPAAVRASRRARLDQSEPR